MSELYILDVAHGNSALLVADGESAVIDAAPGNVLLETIKQVGLTTIEHLFISHADEDHASGAIVLLDSSEIQVRNLHMNPDSTKHGPRWQRLRVAIEDAHLRYGLEQQSLFSKRPPVRVGDAYIITLAPPISTYFAGAGGVTTSGKALTSNSASAVFAVEHMEHRVAIFAGDMDANSLQQISLEGESLDADILVFPHHGGLAGANTETFAEQLTQQVQPRLTVFSIGRHRFRNPRPSVVAAVRRGAPDTHILCTQLSKGCATTLPNISTIRSAQLNLLPASGRSAGECCGGSVRVFLSGSSSFYEPIQSHQDFVSEHVPGALCKQRT